MAVVLPNLIPCCLPPVFGWFFHKDRSRLTSCGCRPEYSHHNSSRALVDASPTLLRLVKYSSASEAAKAMIERDIYGLCRDTKTLWPRPFSSLNLQVSVFYNSQLSWSANWWTRLYCRLKGHLTRNLKWLNSSRTAYHGTICIRQVMHKADYATV